MTRLALDLQSISHKQRSVRSTMAFVMLALVPGTITYALFIDSRILSNILIASLMGVALEALCLKLRARPLLPSLGDGSIIVACWLLMLCVPPTLPLWQITIGIITLVMLGKHLFGGLGHNPFNPAMVAYALLLVSFPVSMTHWRPGTHAWLTPPSSAQHAQATQVTGSDALNWDGLSGATVLDRLRDMKRTDGILPSAELLRTTNKDAQPNTTTTSPLTTKIANEWLMRSPWVWVNAAWLLGGLLLLGLRIISWHIPVAVLAAISVAYTVLNFSGANAIASALPTLFSGGILLGAFFIATDPVSAAASRQGQLLYSCGLGFLCVMIREYSAYPEGMAFAVLLMNICVPLIDYLSTGKSGNMGRRL